MKRYTFAVLALAGAALPALALADSRTLEVPAFHAVEVSSGIKAVVTGEASQSVSASSPSAQDLSDLRWEVSGGVLKFWYDWGLGDLLDFSGRDITITISASLIDGLGASSGASIDAKALTGETIYIASSSGAAILASAAARHYDIEASSGARIEIAGLCDTAKVDASSGATIVAKGLDCTGAELEVSSGAHLDITAHGSIRADVSSGASATVFGGPLVDQLETSSGGTVEFPAASP